MKKVLIAVSWRIGHVDVLRRVVVIVVVFNNTAAMDFLFCLEQLSFLFSGVVVAPSASTAAASTPLADFTVTKDNTRSIRPLLVDCDWDLINIILIAIVY